MTLTGVLGVWVTLLKTNFYFFFLFLQEQEQVLCVIFREIGGGGGGGGTMQCLQPICLSLISWYQCELLQVAVVDVPGPRLKDSVSSAISADVGEVVSAVCRWMCKWSRPDAAELRRDEGPAADAPRSRHGGEVAGWSPLDVAQTFDVADWDRL